MGKTTDPTYSSTLQHYAQMLRELLEDARSSLEPVADPRLRERLEMALSFPQVYICACPDFFTRHLTWSFDDQKEEAIREAAGLARRQIQEILSSLKIGALIHLDENPECWVQEGRFDQHWHRVGHLAFTPNLFAPRWIQDLRDISGSMDGHVESVWDEVRRRNDSPPGSSTDPEGPLQFFR